MLSLNASSLPENTPIYTQCFAVADFCERVVRKELPDLHDPNQDGVFMSRCVSKLGADLSYLAKRAASQTSIQFSRLLQRADSMRVIEIHPESKDAKRLRWCRCDACGNREHLCGYAIDLAGEMNVHTVSDLWNGRVEEIPGSWERFIDRYEDRFNDEDDCRFHYCDYGRFYVGKTCLEKAKRVFLCSTFIQDTLFNMHYKIKDMDQKELTKPELLLVDEVLVNSMIDAKKSLEVAIAEDKKAARSKSLEVAIDAAFWDKIDEYRKRGCADYDILNEQKGFEMHALRERSKASLARMDCVPKDYDNGEEEEECDEYDDDEEEYDEDEDDDDEEDDEEEPRFYRKGRGRKAVVVEDDEDDEDDDYDDGDVAKVTGKKRGRNAAPGSKSKQPKQPKQATRYSKRVAGRKEASSGLVPPQSPQQSVAIQTSVQPEAQPEAQPEPEPEAEAASMSTGIQLPRLQPPSRASRIATAMRIPSADGTSGPLGSRKAALLDLMELQRAMTLENRSDYSAKLSRAIITMQELMDLQNTR